PPRTLSFGATVTARRGLESRAFTTMVATPNPTTSDTTASAATTAARGLRPTGRGVSGERGAGKGSGGSGATVSRSGSTYSVTASTVERPRGASGRGEPAPTADYGQLRQSTMSIATTAPGGGWATYTGYFSARTPIAAA